jgi:hypothetical protein
MLSNLTKVTSNFFFIAALFPFVSFGTNTMDSQPHYIVLAFFSFIFFTFNGLIFRKAIDLIICLMIILLTLVIFDNNFDFIFFRAIASYSGFIITLVVSIIYFERFGIPIKTIVIANLIYIFAALIQIAFGGFSLSFLIISNNRFEPSVAGGAWSLTPEHTFFGIVLFFFSWILLIIYDYKPPILISFLVLINILSIFILAKSSMVIVFLLVSAFVFFIRNLKQKMNPIKILIIPIVLFITLYAFLHIFPGTRFASLITIAEQGGGGLFGKLSEVIHSDASINDRVLNVVFPYYGIVINKGIPGGLHGFYDLSLILFEHFNGYFWSGFGSNKILSFIGAFIYELGLVGVIFILYMYWFLKDNSNPNRFFELILLFTVLNSGIAVAFSLVPVLIAIMYYKKSNSTLNSQNYDSSPNLNIYQ